MELTLTYVYLIISLKRVQPCGMQRQQLYTIHNILFTFHQVPSTAGWTEAMRGEKSAQNSYSSWESRTHDPWHHKAGAFNTLTTVLWVPMISDHLWFLFIISSRHVTSHSVFASTWLINWLLGMVCSYDSDHWYIMIVSVLFYTA